MILKQRHTYEPMPHDGKVIWRIYRGGRCYYKYSPYSLAATQALKAAFPAYWTAIRDYGYAHPQLVPFINEDPMLIVSLVEVGKVRTLDGDGKAYINTGIYAERNTGFDVSLITTDNNNDTCGMLSGSSRGNDAGLELYYWGSVWQIISNNIIATGVPVVVGNQYRIIRLGEDWSVYENGTEKAKGTKAMVTYTSNTPIFLYCLNRGNSVSYQGKPKYIHAIIKQYGGSDIAHFIPMQRTDGTCGMLDIVSLTFYPNANTEGSFTIEITDKAT